MLNTPTLNSSKRPAAPLRTVLLGAGKAGKLLAEAAAGTSAIELVGVASQHGISAAALAQRHKTIALTPGEDWTRLRPDLVLIATPHSLHTSQIITALDLGASVVCDKPLAINRSGLDAIIDAHHRTGQKVFCGFTQRCSSNITACRDFLSSRKTLIRRVICDQQLCRNYQYYSGWKGNKELSGGGVGINQAIHALDLAIYLTGCTLDLIDSHTSDARGLGVEDFLSAHFQSRTGWPLHLSATTHALIEERQTIRIDLVDQCVLIVGSETPAWSVVRDDVQHHIGVLSQLPDIYGPGHLSLLQDACMTILNNTASQFECDLLGVYETHCSLYSIYDR